MSQPKYGAEERNMQHQQEAVGLMEQGRRANPDTPIETVGDLVELGKQSIKREIDGVLGPDTTDNGTEG